MEQSAAGEVQGDEVQFGQSLALFTVELQAHSLREINVSSLLISYSKTVTE